MNVSTSSRASLNVKPLPFSSWKNKSFEVKNQILRSAHTPSAASHSSLCKYFLVLGSFVVPFVLPLTRKGKNPIMAKTWGSSTVFSLIIGILPATSNNEPWHRDGTKLGLEFCSVNLGVSSFHQSFVPLVLTSVWSSPILECVLSFPVDRRFWF